MSNVYDVGDGIRLTAIGERELLPASVRRTLSETEAALAVTLSARRFVFFHQTSFSRLKKPKVWALKKWLSTVRVSSSMGV